MGSGVVGMCKEHLGVALALKVPVFFLVTRPAPALGQLRIEHTAMLRNVAGCFCCHAGQQACGGCHILQAGLAVICRKLLCSCPNRNLQGEKAAWYR